MKSLKAICSGLLLIGCAYTPAVHAEQVVKLAYFGMLSGPNARSFQNGLKMFQAAAEEANAREAKSGIKIEIVPFDNKGDPKESLKLLQEARDQGIAYVAATISGVANALSAAVLEHNTRNPDKPMLFFNYNARDPVLTEDKCNFWHFRFEPHTDMQIRVLVSAITQDVGVKKIYMLNQDYAWGHSVQKAARETLKNSGIEIVGDDLVPLQQLKDFAPYAQKIKASGADSVLTSNWGQDLHLFVKSAHDAGLSLSMFTTHASGAGSPTAIGSSGEDRVKVVNAWFLNAGPSEWQRKVLRYEEKYKATSHMDFLPIWQTVDMFARALSVAGSADPVKVAYALEGMEYKTPGGTSWMRKEDHQLIAPLYVATFTKAGTPEVKYDEEGTGLGWKVEWMTPAKDNIPPMRCQMQRPQR